MFFFNFTIKLVLISIVQTVVQIIIQQNNKFKRLKINVTFTDICEVYSLKI